MDDNSLDSDRLLDSSVVEERLQGVRLLAAQKPLPMDQFKRAFGDQDWRVRKEAVRIFLSSPGARSYTGDIIALLHDPENAGLRNSSIEILISLGPLAVADLSQQISCPDPEVRKFVIDILGEIGQADCADQIIGALSDEDTNVQYAAVETLGKLARKDAVAPLLDLMESADTGLKFTVLEALAQIGGDVPVDRLSSYLTDRVLRKALLDCFGRIGGADVLPYLIEGVTDPMRKVRDASLKSLGRLVVSLPEEVKTALSGAPENLQERLVELLSDNDMETQREAIRLAALSGGVLIGQAMLPLLENDRLRDDVVAAFRTMGEPAFAELLAAGTPADQMASLFLIYLSGELRSEAGMQLAIDALTVSDPQQRYTAVVTLGKIGHVAAIKPLVDLLQDENPDICDATAQALDLFSSECSGEIVAAVTPLLDFPDPALRMRAVRVLGAADGSSVEAALLMALKDPESEVRCEAIKALRGSDSSAYIEGLRLALNDELADVRRLSAEALGGCEEAQALPALALAVEDPDPWVRAASVRALEKYQADEAGRMLCAATGDSVGLVVIAALETLVNRDFSLSLSYLEQALRHTDPEVVKAAIDLLAREGECGSLAEHGLDLLSHPLPDVRVHSIQVFARLCGKDCLPHLEERLQVESEPPVRQALEETVQRLLRTGS